MSFNPKVSIIIPVYNGSNYLKEAIESALAQTYGNIEVIVVNDGSNDGGKTEAIAKSHRDRIRYFSKENGGVSSALNFGIRKAEGEYIGWLSHDDAYMLNKIEVQIDYLRKEDNPNTTILYSDYVVIDENSNYVRVHKINPVEPEYLLYDLLTTWPVHGCTTLIPKACFGEVGLFNENNKTVQDYEMWFRFLKKGYRFKYIPEALTKFRVHAKQDSLLKPDSHYQEREDTYIQAIDLLSDEIKSLPYDKVFGIVLGLRRTKGLPKATNHLLRISVRRKDQIRLLFKYNRKTILYKLYEKLYLITPNFIKKWLRYMIDRFIKVEKSKEVSKCILIVAMSDSIHTARWVNQISDQGWDIHLFPSIDCGLLHPEFRNIKAYIPIYGKRQCDKSVKIVGLPVFNNFIAKGLNFIMESNRFYNKYKINRLAKLIKRLKPDVIHSMEIQHAGYLTLEAKKLFKGKFPPWIVSNWGSDIYLFGRLSEHKPKIMEVLKSCDYYSCECERDVALARSYGFSGKVLPVFPNTGGFDLEKISRLRQPGSTSERRLIMLKGYQGWAYRALVGLRALERCADLLKGYTIAIYLGFTQEVKIAAELFMHSTGIPVKMIPYVSHEEMLRYHGQSRVSIGLSISDAISTSLLEALVMGSFPIQSWTACADEWIENGKTGILVPPEDPDVIEKAIRRALTDDDLVNRAAEENWKTAVERLDQSKLKPKAVELYNTVAKEKGICK